ncbi:hypothetical protein [Psychromonas aquimarina]|uniref:hypothetical protein n=1 Tax=Psychromonas aquimarina TaxID=444919 RepID=UPI0003FB41C8|nr:hypothetical protein [Psychromonas aquimarina]
MFGSSEEKMEKRLQEEKGYLWDEIDRINSKISSQKESVDNISKNAPEHFKELQLSAKDASYYKNRAQEQFNAVENSVSKIDAIKTEIEALTTDAKLHAEYLNEQKTQAKTSLVNIAEYETTINDSKESIANTIDILSELADQKEDLEESINAINTFSEETKEVAGRVKSLMSGFVKDRNEIKELHSKIFGYKTENEDGEFDYVEGLSSELETSYENIKSKLEILGNNISEAETELTNNLNQSKENAERDFNNYIHDCDIEQDEVMKQIKSLLPNALTAGLAGAYEAKTTREENQLSKHDSSFNIAIALLIFCSLLPIAFNIYRLFTNVPLAEVLKDIPVIITMMFPLYMPILWVAYSSSKKYKLSKRLIEEYTHKGVLSKTFEGLSKQVQDIKEDDISRELRNKLLYNLIDVNSENPGKLISDYNKSDHPLMEALDKSSQLADALSKVERVPVLSSLVKHFAEKQSKIIEVNNDKIKDIIDKEIKTDGQTISS